MKLNMEIMMPLMDIFVDDGGLSGGIGRDEKKKIIDSLKPGDVVALHDESQGCSGDTLVFVDKVERQVVIGSCDGFIDSDDRLVRNYLFEFITDIEIVARAGSLASKVLNDQAIQSWRNFRKLQRIEEKVQRRVAEHKAELLGLIE